MAALTFCYDTLRTGGHFVCKFYQGQEDKMLEKRLKLLFEKVHREKPESSRSVSIHTLYVATSQVLNYDRNPKKHTSLRCDGKMDRKGSRSLPSDISDLLTLKC